MAISFDGQVVIVTGAGQSLGRAYALDLAKRGARVVVNDLGGIGTDDGPTAEKVVGEIEAAGGTAVASLDTVATPEGGQAIVDRALDAFGTVDAVIHNAGIWRHELYEDMTPEMLDPVLDVHLRGAVFVTQPAYKVMREKKYGRIVLTSSSTGCFGRVRGTNYAAAKAAMLGLARALSLECEEFGVKANCILPISPFGRNDPVPQTFIDQLREAGLAPELAGPEQVVPASQACSVNGEGFSAGGGRFGRAFIAIADGWIAPKGSVPTAEDIDAHLAEIEDLSSWDIPPTSIMEMATIGRLRKERLG
jgi:NAD(P)-dependent dehydrogenase (short-subunit alcohol dehydrogenase family)